MMKTKEKQMAFNGWTNQATWLVSLWYGDMLTLMADDGYYPESVEALEATVMESFDLPEAGLIADFVNVAFAQVDWQEIYDHYALEEEYDESMDGDAASALASAGFGTDEDYGYTGDIDDRG